MEVNYDRAGAWQDRVHAVARAVRRRVLDHTLRNNGGYLSQACSAAEILATLYLQVMRLGPSEGPLVPLPFAGVPGPANPHSFTGGAYNGPQAPDLDRFIFSPVHYALVLYSVLIEVGRLGPDALQQFNRDGSTVELIGAEHSPGHEVTAGSLGQAISQAGRHRAGSKAPRRFRPRVGVHVGRGIPGGPDLGSVRRALLLPARQSGRLRRCQRAAVRRGRWTR